MRFCVYSIVDAWESITLAELLRHQQENGDLLARAENSGSEGCYVEVARWQPGTDCHSGHWARFAFCKLFDEERDTPELSAYEAAYHYASMINASGGDKAIPFIHRLPTWKEEVAV